MSPISRPKPASIFLIPTIKERAIMVSLVVFHMNGCPHCAAVTGPQSATRGVQDLVPVYEVEASDPLARKMGVSSFPTIFLSTPLVTFKFENARTPQEIRRFVLEKMGQYFILSKLLKKAKLGQPIASPA
jgi:glutaredoxin